MYLAVDYWKRPSWATTAAGELGWGVHWGKEGSSLRTTSNGIDPVAPDALYHKQLNNAVESICMLHPWSIIIGPLLTPRVCICSAPNYIGAFHFKLDCAVVQLGLLCFCWFVFLLKCFAVTKKNRKEIGLWHAANTFCVGIGKEIWYENGTLERWYNSMDFQCALHCRLWVESFM